jgi:hypothetical protein
LGVITTSFFDLSGNEIPVVDGTLFLQEAGSYYLRIKGVACPRAWLGVRPLREQEGIGFRIDIGHWVGESELRIDAEGELQSTPIVVQPRTEKLSESCWIAMLREIEDWLPAATLGTEGGLLGKVGKTGANSSLLIEALVPLLAAFEKALKVLLNQPCQLDRTIWIEKELTNISNCRRETMSWIGKHPEVGAWLDPWKAVELDGSGPKIPQRVSIDSVDHPANRYIAWLVFRITKKLVEVRSYLDQLAKSDSISDETSLWSEARAQRIEIWLARINRVVRGSFLTHIKRKPATESALLTIFDDPVYARVHSMGRLFLSPLFTLEKEEGDLSAAVKPSYTIYEIWCYLALFNQLKEYLTNWTWHSVGLRKLTALTGTGAGAKITARSPSGEKVLQLLFNPVFTSYYARADQARWSLSGERRPDFVISMKEKRKEGWWVFFDAKYRVGRRNLENAFQSVHIYRDSLRYDGYGGTCRAGCLLVPAVSSDSRQWFSGNYRDKYLSGAWELTPGKAYGSEMVEWIMSMLSS